MTTNELTSRNLSLAFELVRDALTDEATAVEIAEFAKGGSIVFVDGTQPDLAAASDGLIQKMKDAGQPVVGLEVQRRVELQPR